ncbi:MAG: TonB-dependent receptor [Acidobacteria bacterium]|nr:TonB-dependent receptor [Acidobacteriota bacterium]
MLFALALTGISLYGQAAVGRISGQVFDSSQAAIPSAKVKVENPGTGLRREALADDQGRFSFPDLPTGDYRVTVEADGFQAQVRNQITLAVAANLPFEFFLSAGTLNEVVEVTATETPVEANAAQGAYFNNKQLIELPINGRDYGRFSLLSPGAVARSNYIADMGFNGMHSIANNFSIDGVDGSRVDQPYMANGFERGARLLTGSLETIGEVRVQSGNYKAEYGRSAGSSIAIVTRSGTNDFHGSIFNFFRNDFLDARNFFNTKPAPMAPFRYNNPGGNIAGAIVKNKVFYMLAYEGSRQGVGITGSQTVPSALLRSQVLATSPALRTIVDQFPMGQSPTSNPYVDSYTTTGVSRVREDTGSVRVDYNLSDRDKIFGRFNLNDSETRGPLFGVTPTAVGLTDFQQVPVTTTNATVSYSRVWSPYIVTEWSAGLQRWGSSLNSETNIPQVNITGISAVVGSRRFSRTNSQVNQYGGSVSIVNGSHTVKAGGMWWHTGVNPYSRGLTTLQYTSIDDFINNRLNQMTSQNGDPGSGRRQDHVGVYLQDTWQARPGLTVDLGLRWDVAPPNHGEYDRYRTFDTRTMTLGAVGGQWYKMNKKNLGPRIALSYQPYKKLVIRTGYGIFYQQYPPGNGYNLAANTIPGNTTILRSDVAGLAYPYVPASGVGTVALPNVEGFHWTKPEFYAQQWNFTLIHELPGQMSLQAAYVGNRGLNLRRARNINFFDPALGRRPIAGYANVNVEYNDAQSVYHGLQVNLTRRYSSGLTGTFNYTYAKAIDNVQDYALYSTQPQDNRCLGGCERGLGSGDVRHNVTYNALYDLPFGKGRKYGGWQISSLALLRSGIASSVAIGVNTFGNSNLANQRPNVVAGQNVFAANQSINNWYNTAAFSLPAAGTFGNAARNIGRGPDLINFDASITKNTKLSERFNLRCRGEVFNVFNRPNFDFANSTYNTVNFGRIFNTFGRTIGFGTSRQIQLSMRLMF